MNPTESTPWSNLDDAVAFLQRHREFDWLVSGSQHFYSAMEVAAQMGVGDATIRNRCASGDIPATNYGGQRGWVIARESLLRYFAANYSATHRQ